MQIDLIVTFLDLCETRSFNRTAERLGLTQSTVSGRVRTLENALGRRLFTRSRAGTQLTTAGLRFEPHARSLRHGWTEALHATRDPGAAAITLRVGIQHDLAEEHIGEWIPEFRSALPQTALYVEADYSAQMCSDLIAGSLDLGMMFSPSLHPDLHFETLGEVAYRMIAPDQMDVRSVIPEAYVLANYSAAFARAHDALHPTLGVAAASSGHGASVTALALALGWAAYVPDHTARALIGAGRAAAVSGAAVILQTVHAGIHVRHRHRGMHRRLLSLLRVQFPALRSGPLV